MLQAYPIDGVLTCTAIEHGRWIMADKKLDQTESAETASDLSRREFVGLSVAASLAMAAGSASGAELPVVETAVAVTTPDGTCDAMFIHPTTGTHPAVLIWPDAGGLRPRSEEHT